MQKPSISNENENSSDSILQKKSTTELLAVAVICLLVGAGIGIGIYRLMPYTVQKTYVGYMIDHADFFYGENLADADGETTAMSITFVNFNNQSQILHIYWVTTAYNLAGNVTPIGDEILQYSPYTLNDASDGVAIGQTIDLEPNEIITIFSENPDIYVTIYVRETFQINPITQRLNIMKQSFNLL